METLLRKQNLLPEKQKCFVANSETFDASLCFSLMFPSVCPLWETWRGLKGAVKTTKGNLSKGHVNNDVRLPRGDWIKNCVCQFMVIFNLVPRACDPWEGNEGSGIIRCRKPGILAKIELRIHFNGQSDSSLKRIIPEPSFPSQGSQARGTRLGNLQHI